LKIQNIFSEEGAQFIVHSSRPTRSGGAHPHTHTPRGQPFDPLFFSVNAHSVRSAKKCGMLCL